MSGMNSGDKGWAITIKIFCTKQNVCINYVIKRFFKNILNKTRKKADTPMHALKKFYGFKICRYTFFVDIYK